MATTFDDMTGVSTDRLYTFDDPLFNVRLDNAYNSGVIMRDGPALTLDQSASGIVYDGFDTVVARDTFIRTAVGSGWGSPTLAIPGQSWTAGTTQLSTDGIYGLISPAATATVYYATLGGYSQVDFDFAVQVRPTVFFTGAKGSVYLFARFTDFNNCLRFRVDFNTDQIIGYAIDYMLAGTPTNINPGGLVQNFFQLANQFYWIRAQGNGSTIRLKIWASGSIQPDEWATTKVDPQWATTPGAIGTGFAVSAGNTNALSVPHVQYSMFWSGLQKVLDNAGVGATLSLDDGLPQGASNTDLIGVSEASAKLLAPVGERPSLYFSPFRSDKPFGGFQDRDVSTVAMSSGALTDDGLKTVRFFTGQMTDIPLDGDDASLTAVSRCRLKMSTLIQPPAIHGTFEGCELTWLIGYALYKSGVQNVPPTLPGIRHYSPMNGSTHAYVPDDNVGPFGFSEVYRFPPGVSQWTRPPFIDGPYAGTAALDGDITKTRTLKWTSQGPMRLGPGPDFMSQTASQGRIEFWVKGNAFDVNGSPDAGAAYLAWFKLQNPAGTRYVNLYVPTDTQLPSALISDGTTTINFPAQGIVPSDNQWHFVACSWDFPGNSIRVGCDGISTAYVLSGLALSALPGTDDVNQINAAGYWPLAELRVTAGSLAPLSKSPWVRDTSWSRDCVTRRSLITLDGLAQTAPREAFELISSIAQAELARIGFDNNDKFLYLTLPYWAEGQQQTPLETISTATNLGGDFKPFRDVSKIYNQIRITYEAKTVQEIWVAAYTSSNLLAIPVGFSTFVVPLSGAAVEIRNVTAGLTVLSGAALAAAPPSDANAINYVTANTATDGTGTYATAANLTASIIAWDPGEVTLAFINNSGSIMYVSNNVNIPSMGIAAKVLVGVPQSVVASSVVSGQQPMRGTRVLPIDQVEFLQNAHDASAIAAELSSRLGYPRVTLRTSVWGDPRRQPGPVVNVVDPDRSMITGIYRLISVSNNQQGADFQQQLILEQALPVGQWDTGVWDNVIWGPN